MKRKTIRTLARGFLLFAYFMIAVSLYGIYRGWRML